MSSDVPSSASTDFGVGIIEDYYPLLPEGEVLLAYLDYCTAFYYGRPKVGINFAVLGDDNCGEPVTRWYNVTKLKGPPRRYGDFVPPSRGDLVREYQNLVGSDVRLDRISFEKLKGLCILSRLKTVTKERRGKPLAPGQQYTVVEELLAILEPNDPRWQK